MALSSTIDEQVQQEYLRGTNLHLLLYWQHISTLPYETFTRPYNTA